MILDFSEWESDNLNSVAKRNKVDMREMKRALGVTGSYANFSNMLDGGTVLSKTMRDRIELYIETHKEDKTNGSGNHRPNPSKKEQ